MAKRSYTITEAAKKLNVSRQPVHEAIKRGFLDAEKGKITQERIIKVTVQGWKIPAKSLDTYQVSLLHQRAGKMTVYYQA